jgi:thiamine biosynthesis protein ThiS
LARRRRGEGGCGTIAFYRAMTIKLNGDPHQVPGPLSVSALLEQLEIDARRVAVELNLAVVKKAAYDSSVINDGDEVEIVNFVGGG